MPMTTIKPTVMRIFSFRVRLRVSVRRAIVDYLLTRLRSIIALALSHCQNRAAQYNDFRAPEIRFWFPADPL